MLGNAVTTIGSQLNRRRHHLRNSGWLFFDTLMVRALAVIPAWLVARSYGPEEYGAYSFAMALILLLRNSICGLGLQGIVIQQLVTRHQERSEIISAAGLMRFLSGALCAGLVYVYAHNAKGIDQRTATYLIVLSPLLFLAAGEVFEYAFHAERMFRKATIWKLIALGISFIIKLILLHVGCKLVWIVVVSMAEAALQFCFLAIAYSRATGLGLRIDAKTSEMKHLLRISWPLMLTSIGSVINIRIGEVMLGTMLGPTQVGLYSAATRISETLFMIPTAVITAVYPALIAKSQRNTAEYHRSLEMVFSVMLYGGAALCLPLSLFSKPLINLMYGPEYGESSTVLSIHVIGVIFSFLGAPLAKAMIIEDAVNYNFLRQGGSAALNILLNIVLIPKLGITGAAWANVISIFSANYLTAFLHPRMRKIGFIMTRSSILPYAYIARVIAKE